ncbi:MAG TPA: hypothetical protein VM925_01375 [Labilithrix sp.]|nr:hypothetical protein [Labilithrix sp.]
MHAWYFGRVMTSPLIDAFDLMSHAEVLEERLAAAVFELSKRPALAEEKAWLAAAHRHVARAREGIGDLPTRSLRLSELQPLRGERGRALQGAVVDAAERLYAAIGSAGGERSPLLEAVYRNLKTPAMRRCGRDEFEKFCGEVEKRLGSSYVKRMLADPSYAPIEPALAQLGQAFTDWRSVFASEPPAESEARVLRDELESTARRLELASRQARLLAEAALLPAKELLDASGILDKPKRRGGRRAETDGTSPSPETSPRNDAGVAPEPSDRSDEVES